MRLGFYFNLVWERVPLSKPNRAVMETHGLVLDPMRKERGPRAELLRLHGHRARIATKFGAARGPNGRFVRLASCAAAQDAALRRRMLLAFSVDKLLGILRVCIRQIRRTRWPSSCNCDESHRIAAERHPAGSCRSSSPRIKPWLCAQSRTQPPPEWQRAFAQDSLHQARPAAAQSS